MDDIKEYGDLTLQGFIEKGQRASEEMAQRNRLRSRDKALALVGKCYRKADFTGETKHWRQYAIVTGVDDDGCLSAFTFNFFGDYSFDVSYSRDPYFRDGDDCGNQWEECSRDELLAGWDKAMSMLNQKASAALQKRL